MALEITKAVWQRAFLEVEAELIAEGYTCDDLAPAGELADGSGKRCIACETSLRLRAKLLGPEHA